MVVDGVAEQEVVSHPFPLELPLVSAALQSVPVCASHYKLYSRPRCIVLKFCFWFWPGISQSLGFERVTDVPPDRAVRVQSAYQELEKIV